MRNAIPIGMRLSVAEDGAELGFFHLRIVGLPV